MQFDPAVRRPLEPLGRPLSFATLPPFMKRAICLMTLVPAALFASCGGGDSAPETPIPTPTVSTPSKLTKEQFIKEADGFCAEVNAALGSLSNSSTSSASAAGQRADLYRELIDDLRGLGTPDDQTGLDEFFSAGDDIASAEESADQATQNGDDAALASAESEAASAESAFSSAASAYGFQECGQGPTTPSSTTPSSAVPVTPAAPAAPVTTAPIAPAAPPGTTGAGGGTAGTGTGTGGGSTGTGGTTGGSGGVGPG
jgi:hypothetical protein